MKINLFHKDYTKINTLYNDFLQNHIINKPIYSSFDEVEIKDPIPFKIYFGKTIQDKENGFLESIRVVKEYYHQLDREYLYDQRFWNTIFLKYNSEYYLNLYPTLKTDTDLFAKRIFLKDFNWENYVYKLVIAVDFIESNVDFEKEKEKFYSMIFDNLDIFNYIIKYPIFRSGDFLLKILRIIENNNISSELKARLKHMKGDKRLGRMIIFELNKLYPVLMSPLMSQSELEKIFMDIYSEYSINEKNFIKL